MPEMDGYEATRKIRVIEGYHSKKYAESENHGYSHKQIPIIAMTANVFKEDVVKCLEVGMNDRIGKPLYMDEFFNMLRKYLL
jgi:CheY-like chemotaxis protein